MPLNLALALAIPALGQRASGPFTPAVLGPSAWYDGLTLTTQSKTSPGFTQAVFTDPLAQWLDRSGNNNTTNQTTGIAQPTVAAPGPSFDGGDKIVSAALTQVSIPQPYTWIVVADNQLNTSMYFDNGSGATRNLAQRGAATTEIQINAGTTLLRTGVPDLTIRRAWFFAFNGASSTIKCGTGGSVTQQGAAGNAGTNPCAQINLGGNASALLVTNTGAGFGMGEAILVPRLLSAGEETSLLTYFARHGI